MKNQIPNTKTQIPRSGKTLEVGAILNDMRRAGLGLGAWYLELGAWSLILGAWYLDLGTSTSGYAIAKTCNPINFQEYAIAKTCRGINFQEYAIAKTCKGINFQEYAIAEIYIRISTRLNIHKSMNTLKLNQV